MFCPKCFYKIDDTSAICPFCGSEVSFEEAASSRPTPDNTFLGIPVPIPTDSPEPAADIMREAPAALNTAPETVKAPGQDK